MNIKKIAKGFFKEPVVRINVGQRSKIKYFIICDGKLETFTNKKEMAQCYEKKSPKVGVIVIEGITLKE